MMSINKTARLARFARRSSQARLMKWSEDSARVTNQFQNDCNRVHELVLEAQDNSRPFAKRTLIEIIMLSNEIYKYYVYCECQSKIRQWKHIFVLYRKMLNALEGVISSFVELMQTNEHNNIIEFPLTQYKAGRVRSIVRGKTAKLERKLNSFNVDTKLIQILVLGVEKVLQRKPLYTTQAHYISRLISNLEKDCPKTTLRLISRLYRFNFNTTEFLEYVCYHCDRLLMHEQNNAGELKTLLQLNNHIEVLQISTDFGWSNTHIDVRKCIKRFIRTKIKMNALRETEVLRSGVKEERYRLHLAISVAQIGLLKRLLVGTGIIKNKEVAKVNKFFADNFRTDQTEQISVASLKNKSLNVEFSTVLKVRRLLQKMLKSLDENFNSDGF